jgi:hypothetical protein
MRRAALALISVLALVACSPKAPANSNAGITAPANPGGVIGNMFPNLFQASYRLEATMSPREGVSDPVVMVRSGQNMRMEMDTHGQHVTVIHNAATHQGYTIMNMAGRQVAMQVDMSGENGAQDPLQRWANQEGYTITRGGPCAGAGETGAEWTSTKTSDPTETHTICVTGDGIVLQVKDGDRVMWQTTRVQRGPQDVALFSLPPGVQVMDLGNAGAMLSRMRGGESKPSNP